MKEINAAIRDQKTTLSFHHLRCISDERFKAKCWSCLVASIDTYQMPFACRPSISKEWNLITRVLEQHPDLIRHGLYSVRSNGLIFFEFSHFTVATVGAGAVRC